MRVLKIIFGTLFKKVTDAVLFELVVRLTLRFVFREQGTGIWDFTLSKRLLIILFVSLAIGIVQIVFKLAKKEKEEEKQTENPGCIIGALMLLVSTAVAALVFFLLDKLAMEESTNIILKLLVVVLCSILVQTGFLGTNSLSGRITFYLIRGAHTFFRGIGAVMDFLGRVVTSLCEVLGPHIITALIEILFCGIGVLVTNLLGKKLDILQKYQAMESVSLREWVSDYLGILFLDKLGLTADNGIFDRISEIQVSGITFAALNLFPFACGVAALLCLLFGVGFIAKLSRKLLGWGDGIFENYERTHENTWRWNSILDRLEYTNGNPFGIFVIIIFIIVLAINMALGLYMPVWILGNLIIGILLLPVRIILNRRESKED